MYRHGVQQAGRHTGGDQSVGPTHHSVQVLLVNKQGLLPTCPARCWGTLLPFLSYRQKADRRFDTHLKSWGESVSELGAEPLYRLAGTDPHRQPPIPQ